MYYRDFSRLYNRPKLTILEFGIAAGGSLHFYRTIFGAGVRIIGVDPSPNSLKIEEYGFKIFIGNQSDLIFMA